MLEPTIPGALQKRPTDQSGHNACVWYSTHTAWKRSLLLALCKLTGLR